MGRPVTLTDDERKSARVSLLITPQLLRDVTTLARMKNISLNDVFTSLAAQVVKKNHDAIKKVQQVIEAETSNVQMSLFDEDSI